MAFKKGDNTINRKGRPKGSRNKSNNDIREILAKFLNNNLDGLQCLYDLSAPAEQIRIIAILLKYVVALPFNPEALSEDQLEQIIKHLKNEQEKKHIISRN